MKGEKHNSVWVYQLRTRMPRTICSHPKRSAWPPQAGNTINLPNLAWKGEALGTSALDLLAKLVLTLRGDERADDTAKTLALWDMDKYQWRKTLQS